MHLIGRKFGHKVKHLSRYEFKNQALRKSNRYVKEAIGDHLFDILLRKLVRLRLGIDFVSMTASSLNR